MAAALVLAGSLGVQVSSALASGLFSTFGTLGTSSLRFLVAALILLAIFRPKLRGRSRSNWLGIAIYGASMAAMNMCLYAAIERLPLGVAVTLEFLGPITVALLASRRITEALCAVGALAGVVLIAGPGGHFDLIGYAFGLGAALFFGLYTVFSARVGKTNDSMSGLALSVAFAAVLSLPFGIPVLHLVDLNSAGILLVSATIGVVLTFTADTLAARVSSSRVVGTLFSIDPVVGAVAGAVILGQSLTLTAVLGIVAVVGSGAALVWASGSNPPHVPER
nr:EamA family transporter [Lysinibacter cavernae]